MEVNGMEAVEVCTFQLGMAVNGSWADQGTKSSDLHALHGWSPNISRTPSCVLGGWRWSYTKRP